MKCNQKSNKAKNTSSIGFPVPEFIRLGCLAILGMGTRSPYKGKFWSIQKSPSTFVQTVYFQDTKKL